MAAKTFVRTLPGISLTAATLAAADRGKLSDKFEGSLLCVMIADAMGAAVEGHSWKSIERDFPNGLREYVAAPHMGIPFQGERTGMYTDDTTATLSLASSIVQLGGLHPEHAALSQVSFWAMSPLRGCPDSASKLFRSILNGMSYTKSGRSMFPDGSYANGGCMKIAPVALAFRNASDAQLRVAVEAACMATHVHPEAVDGAFAVAYTVRYCVLHSLKSFDSLELLRGALEAVQTEAMKEKISVLVEEIGNFTGRDVEDDRALLATMTDPFQIKAVDAAAVTLWMVARYALEPEEAIVNTFRLGGDTDTTGSMVGGAVGALHGCGWIRTSWLDGLENGPRGRDYCRTLAQGLSALSLTSVLDTLSEEELATVREVLPPKDFIRN